MKFESPVVGIHVRRTDKVGTEAAFHPVEEYMKHVEEWFEKHELNHEPGPRRVFVASDDPKVGIVISLFDTLISVSDPDSGFFWIRIHNPKPDPGAYKRSKRLNNHNIILLFSDFYNILFFN